jgi:hypothetical protein
MIIKDLKTTLLSILSNYDFVNKFGRRWEISTFCNFMRNNGKYFTPYDYKNLSDYEISKVIVNAPQLGIFRTVNNKLFFNFYNYLRQENNTVISVNSDIDDMDRKRFWESIKLSFEYMNIQVNNAFIFIKTYIDELDNYYENFDEEKILMYLNKILTISKFNYKFLFMMKKLKDIMFKINNEYYPDDNKNFIKNRINKDINKQTGFYFFDKVIMYERTKEERRDDKQKEKNDEKIENKTNNKEQENDNNDKQKEKNDEKIEERRDETKKHMNDIKQEIIRRQDEYNYEIIQLDKELNDKNVMYLSKVPYKFSILSYKKSDKINWNIRVLINKKPCETFCSKNLLDPIADLLKEDNEELYDVNCFNMITLICRYVYKTKEENKIFIPWKQ